LQLPQGALIVFDPVTHTAQFLDVTQKKSQAQMSGGPGCDILAYIWPCCGENPKS